MKAAFEKVAGFWKTSCYSPVLNAKGELIDVLISAGMLVGLFQMKLKTIRNGVSKYHKKKSEYWMSFQDRKAVMISYNELPPNAKSRWKIPTSARAVYDLMVGQFEEKEESHKEQETLLLKNLLVDAYHHRWPRHIRAYNEKIVSEEARILHAKSHALLEAILEAESEKWPTKVIFEIYCQIINDELHILEVPRLSTVNFRYFKRIIRRCKAEDIPSVLIHNSLGKPKEYLVKMTGPIKAFIRLLLRDPKRLLIRDIIAKVEKEYRVTLHKSSIKSFRKDSLTRNIVDYDANGKIWSRQNGMPKITRYLAEGAGEIFQGDYYRLQFVCLNDQRKVIRLVAFVVLDVFSKKVVGWALAEEKSATIALDAFHHAFASHGILPEEIVIDNDSYYNKWIFKYFLKLLNLQGVITTFAHPNIPTWKAEIEGAFAVIQKLHSAKPWYIGESVRSKNKRGNPAPEYVKAMRTKKSAMLSVHEMIKAFGDMMEEYNNTIPSNQTLTRTDNFRYHRSHRSIQLEFWMESLLFWKCKIRKMIKDDGRIDLIIDNKRYIYQVTESDKLWKHKKTYVIFCYNLDDLSKVHAFEQLNRKFIGEIEPRLVMTHENKAKVLARQRSILRGAEEELKRLRNEDWQMVNQSLSTHTSRKADSLDQAIIKHKMRKNKTNNNKQKVISTC